MLKNEQLVDEFLISLGKVIKSLRSDRKLSQEKLAEETGLTRNFISLIECGQSNPSIGNLAAISRVLEVRLSFLVAQSESV